MEDLTIYMLRLLKRHPVYWLSADAVAEALGVTESEAIVMGDWLVENDFAECLDYTIVWYRITERGRNVYTRYCLDRGVDHA